MVMAANLLCAISSMIKDGTVVIKSFFGSDNDDYT